MNAKKLAARAKLGRQGCLLIAILWIKFMAKKSVWSQTVFAGGSGCIFNVLFFWTAWAGNSVIAAVASIARDYLEKPA